MKLLSKIVTTLGTVFTLLSIVAIIKKPKSVYQDSLEEQNPFEGKRVKFVEDETETENADGKRGHLEIIGESQPKRGLYERVYKRLLDVMLSFFGLVILSPIYAIISIAIVIDDPGPVLFIQKRVGKNKQFFTLHKFRSMKMSTPHDIPTHMLSNPESYITRVGKVLRKFSLDELPQIWDIFIGNMSVIGPRPALWNQDVLTAYRDEYGANDVTPGLTGWAQINGRDELDIMEKARYDGEYCKNMSFKMDIKCFLLTIANVLRQEGIVEGGTGSMAKHMEKRKRYNEKLYYEE